jgi:hypothetical protein
MVTRYGSSNVKRCRNGGPGIRRAPYPGSMPHLADTPAARDLTTSGALRRGLAARLRTLRLHEIAAWAAIVAAVYGIRDGAAKENAALVLLGAVGVMVRLVIATESVRYDETGVTWRSLFVTYHLAWHEITSMEVVARAVRLRLLRGGASATTLCLAIERGPDLPPLYVTPSVWVPLVRQGEFLAAARLMSPHEWTVPGQDHPGHHRGSGKRVGRPSPRARRSR